MRSGKSEALIRKDYFYGEMRRRKRVRKKIASRSRNDNRRISKR